jgi:hypothetical protein
MSNMLKVVPELHQMVHTWFTNNNFHRRIYSLDKSSPQRACCATLATQKLVGHHVHWRRRHCLKLRAPAGRV